MENIRPLIDKIMVLKDEYQKIREENNKLADSNNKKIIKEDIDKYLSDNNIIFEKKTDSHYLIKNIRSIKEILVIDSTIQFVLDRIYIYSLFDIEVNAYGVFGDAFKIDNQAECLSDDNFINDKIYYLNIETLEKLASDIENTIETVKKHIDYLKQHHKKEDYSYKYSLYNEGFVPEVFFENFDEVVEYLIKSIEEYRA